MHEPLENKSGQPDESCPAASPQPAHSAPHEVMRRSGSSMERKMLAILNQQPASPGDTATTSHCASASSPLHGVSPASSPSPPRRTVKVEAPDVVFVGAGPVGLWAAIQLKLRKPELGIRMIERREKYTRDNVVKLKTDRFDGCAQDEWGVIADLKFKLQESPFIPIQVFERTLMNVAKNLNVDIQIAPEGVSDVQTQVVDAYPGAAIIVGSDGAHSGVRTQMFGEDNYHKQPLRFAAHIKYDIEGTAQKIGQLELYPLAKKMHNHLVHEHVGRCRDGKTSVTMQVFIDEQTYASLKGGATAKNPVRIFSREPGAAVPRELLDDVKSMLGLQIVNHNARIDPTSARLSVTEIPQYYCDSVIEPHDGKGRYKALLGDAAMGLSFFKGLNAGLKSANKFAAVVARNWSVSSAPGESASSHKFSEYQKWFGDYAKMKIKKGNQKNLQLSRINSFLSFANQTRGHLLKYSDRQFNSFKQAVDDLIDNPGAEIKYKKISPSLGL